MDDEQVKKYEESVRDVIGMHAIVLGRGGDGYIEFDAWLAAHDAEVRAGGVPVTDDMVAEALDAKATMSQLHCYLYSTEKCRCGEEWTDAHWMRFILERALSRAGVVAEEPEWEPSAQDLLDAIYDPDEDDERHSVRYGYILEQFERLMGQR
ncbi:hypothetical protein [Microbacterium sp. NPDC057944]|uniref:hypothetical protein n=1 Tax=Microbacterium sp. NPDC057944 TaxID=3346286 RepID=UPI0036DC1B39